MGRRTLLGLGCVAAMLTAVAPIPGSALGVSAPTTSSSTSSLEAQRAQLEQQLSAVQGPRSDALRQLRAAEADLSTVETTLAQTQKQLDAADARLRDLSSQIATHEHGLTAARAELASLLRSTYEASGGDGFAGAVLAANDFGQAMERLRGAQHLTSRLQDLQAQVTDSERALLDERSQVRQQFTTAQALEDSLNQQQGHLLVAVAQRDQAFNALNGDARGIASQIARIDDQLAPAPPAAPSGPVSSSPCGNRFAYGNCTYYVATRRCIPWLGNAYQWWDNARAAGFAEGQTPQVGAVAVWGRMASSPVGHVAYVEAVGPSNGVPAGSFLISEMNYSGWNRVDYRVVHDGAAGLLGFIYGKA